MLETPATPRVDLQAALMPAPAALPAVPAPAWSCPAFEVLDLTQVTLVASGSERDVYLHPGDKSLLIKIVNRARINEPGRKRPWHKRLHREDAHRVFITELVEYIATTVQQRLRQGNTLMARIAGLVLTSHGLGLAVSASSMRAASPRPRSSSWWRRRDSAPSCRRACGHSSWT